MANLDDKKQDALDAVNAAFSDTSVPRIETLAILEEIQDLVDTCISALKAELERDGEDTETS